VHLLHSKNTGALYRYIEEQRDKQFDSAVLDEFLAADIDLNRLQASMEADGEFNGILYNTPLTAKDIDDYIRMIIFSIDFRSSQTVLHTMAVAFIAGMLAEWIGMKSDEREAIATGAMLHDIGKISTPVSILESPNKLTPAEMEIMKNHVVISETILRGNADEKIINIAVNHHEKLNGAGYPKGLNESDIALSDRIVAVADILSALCFARSYKEAFPKQKTVDILEDMSAKHFIDAQIVELAVSRFDEILTETQRMSQPITESYNTINHEYARLRKALPFTDSAHLTF
jgi:putative nucleotidyltransferase with HDIG domain